MTTCPEPSRLKDLLDGNLPEAEQAELNQHLETCETCQHALESLVAGDESWSGAARQLNETQATPEPALEEAIAWLKGDRTETHLGDGPADEISLDFLTPTDQPGRLGKLDHYEVIEVIGKGGFGVVLKAFDPELHRHVAIKVLSPHLATSTAARKRFQREAKAAAAVNHEHVVAIHAVVSNPNGLPYLVMQYVAGASLQERIDREGPLQVQEILRIGMQAAHGLAAAHAQGLVHRDIKPANILLENGVERVKISDFGLARAVDDASVTQSGVIAGTPQYMSPEQARGESVDHRTDLFSLGSVLYAMCTARPPFRASTTMGVLKRVSDDTPRSVREVNPDIPDWLEAIIQKLHAKERGERFQSAGEVAELLGQHLAHLQQPGVVPRPQRIPVESLRPARKEPPLTAALFLGVGSVGVFFVVWGAAQWGLGDEGPGKLSMLMGFVFACIGALGGVIRGILKKSLLSHSGRVVAGPERAEAQEGSRPPTGAWLATLSIIAVVLLGLYIAVASRGTISEFQAGLILFLSLFVGVGIAAYHLSKRKRRRAEFGRRGVRGVEDSAPATPPPLSQTAPPVLLFALAFFALFAAMIVTVELTQSFALGVLVFVGPILALLALARWRLVKWLAAASLPLIVLALASVPAVREQFALSTGKALLTIEEEGAAQDVEILVKDSMNRSVASLNSRTNPRVYLEPGDYTLVKDGPWQPGIIDITPSKVTLAKGDRKTATVSFAPVGTLYLTNIPIGEEFEFAPQQPLRKENPTNFLFRAGEYRLVASHPRGAKINRPFTIRAGATTTIELDSYFNASDLSSRSISVLYGFEWFPADATFFGGRDMWHYPALASLQDLMAMQIFENVNQPFRERIWKIKANLASPIPAVPNHLSSVDRITFAYVDDAKNSGRAARVFVRVTGRLQRQRVLDLLKQDWPGVRITVMGENRKPDEQGPWAGTVTLVDSADPTIAPAMAFVGDRDLIFAGYIGGDRPHLDAIKEVLDVRAGRKANLPGVQPSRLQDVPQDAFALMIGEPPAVMWKTLPGVTADSSLPRKVHFTLSGNEHLDFNLRAWMASPAEAQAFAGRQVALRTQAQTFLKNGAALLPMKAETVTALARAFENAQIGARENLAEVSFRVPSAVMATLESGLKEMPLSLIWQLGRTVWGISAKPVSDHERVLKRFSPATDKPITQEGVTVEKDGWRIEVPGLRPPESLRPREIRLFELPNPGVENCVITFRAQVRVRSTIEPGLPRIAAWLPDLELKCVIKGKEFAGESHSYSPLNPLQPSEGYVCETPLTLWEGESPEMLKLNLRIGWASAGTIWIKNVEVIAAPRPGATATAPSSDGFVPLFNGRDLTGWKTLPDQPGNWRVENGILVGRGPATSHLFSERDDFENFHLRAEARINDGGNSGVYFRVPRLAATRYDSFPDGYEANINSTHTDQDKTGSLTGSLRGVAPFKDQLHKPDEWFTLEVIARGTHLVIKVNGQTTVDRVDANESFKKGHLALQVWPAATVVQFRKIEIKELPATPTQPPADIPRKPSTNRRDEQLIQGEWAAWLGERDGKAIDPKLVNLLKSSARVTVAGNRIRITVPGAKDVEGTFVLDPSQSPKALRIAPPTPGAEGWHGVYDLGEDSLHIHYAGVKRDRPGFFGTKPGDGSTRLQLRRERPEGWIKLFNGDDLNGWEGLKEHWKWSHESVVGSSQGRSVAFNTHLCGLKIYRDFELRFQVRLDDKDHCALVFRGDVVDRERFLVTGPQLGLGLSGWGSITAPAFWSFSNRPSIRANDFNDVYLKCVGRRVSVQINGVTLWDGVVPSLPDDGVIALQLPADKEIEVSFRKMEIKELAAEKSADKPGP